MYKGKTFLGIIPARGGSKGVPRKNIRPLAGKPLIAWTIAQAQASRYLDRTIVSTEDEEIAAVARRHGGDVPFLRPVELARDDTPSIAPVLHAIGILRSYDFIVLLQDTSPFRTAEDIDGAIAHGIDHGADSCVSVTEAAASPYWMYRLRDDGTMTPILERPREKAYQRQKLPKIYQLNGAVYVASREFLLREKAFVSADTLGCVMPGERSFDIDTMMDFRIAEALMVEKEGFRMLPVCE